MQATLTREILRESERLRDAAEPVRPSATAVFARDGSSARRRRVDGVERLEVRDAESRLLFSWEPASGRASVYQPAGDLQLAAPGGDVSLVAGGAVRVVGAEALDLQSAGRVELRSGAGERRARLALGSGRAALEGDAVDLEAGRARLKADRLDVGAARAEARVERGAFHAGVLELTAERVRQTVRRLHQRVEELLDVSARRMRSRVDETLLTRAGRVVMLARGRVRIDGEKIDLG